MDCINYEYNEECIGIKKQREINWNYVFDETHFCYTHIWENQVRVFLMFLLKSQF